MVFVDYQNVHGSALRAFWPRGTHPANGHIDPLKLGELIVARRHANGFRTDLAQVRLYRGRPNPEHQPQAAAANDRQADAWTRSPLVVAKRRTLRYPPNWPRQAAVEKGIDVALAVDILRLAAVDDCYDVAVVFSGDTDLVPAIEAVRELKCAHIEVAAWRGGGGRLRTDGASSLWCHWLDETDYRAVLDPTDYSKPRA